ncbi:MAG: hypothetical protein QOF81_1496 [Acidimicrobiaceae bacterium]|nr:hypothetical protein [Acidimicrobiaceae bacterium]
MSWPSRNQPQEGFTLVEVLVALVIITTGLLVLASTMYSAFGSIGFSRQRDTATQLANQAMEQIKALNFRDLVMLVSDDSTQVDPLVTCAGSPTACTFGSPARTIPTVSAGSAPPAPLYPHIFSPPNPPPGITKYTVSSYVTFDPNGNTQARVATVRVIWDHPVKGASALVQIESTIFANGPVASGPAHAFTAQADDTPGTISVTGTLLGINLASVSFGPGSTHAAIAVDGTATGQGTVAPSTLQLAGQTLLTTSQSNAVATSGPGQAMQAPGAVVVNNGGPLGPVQSILGLDTGALGISGGVGVQATTQALAASSAVGGTTLAGQAIPNSSLPFAQGKAQQSGPVSLGLNLSVLNILGIQILNVNIPLISITPLGNGNPDLATVCQQSTSGAGCQGAMPPTGNVTGVAQPSFPGQAIAAQAQKSFSRITVLPGLGTPLVDIQGFTAAASAAAGPGISNSGKAGTDAVSVNVAGASIPVATLLNAIVNSPLTNVSAGLLGNVGVIAHLKFGGGSTNGNSALVTSPMTLTVDVSLAGLLTLSVNVNFGSVTANASYS